MDERWFIFDELTPEESLRFLATLPPLKEDAPLIKGIRIKLQGGRLVAMFHFFFPIHTWRRGGPLRLKVRLSYLAQ